MFRLCLHAFRVELRKCVVTKASEVHWHWRSLGYIKLRPTDTELGKTMGHFRAAARLTGKWIPQSNRLWFFLSRCHMRITRINPEGKYYKSLLREWGSRLRIFGRQLLGVGSCIALLDCHYSPPLINVTLIIVNSLYLLTKLYSPHIAN